MRDLQHLRDALDEQHCLLQAPTEEILRRYLEELDRQWSQKSFRLLSDIHWPFSFDPIPTRNSRLEFLPRKRATITRMNL
jgi:hypothetical protein